MKIQLPGGGDDAADFGDFAGWHTSIQVGKIGSVTHPIPLDHGCEFEGGHGHDPGNTHDGPQEG